jgi:hypothetical protein
MEAIVIEDMREFRFKAKEIGDFIALSQEPKNDQGNCPSPSARPAARVA